MKKTNFLKRIASFSLCALMLFSAVSCSVAPSESPIAQQIVGENNYVEELVKPESGASAEPTGKYNDGVVLIKHSEEIDDKIIEQLNFKSAEPLYPGADWYYVELKEDTDTVETVPYRICASLTALTRLITIT